MTRRGYNRSVAFAVGLAMGAALAPADWMGLILCAAFGVALRCAYARGAPFDDD